MTDAAKIGVRTGQSVDWVRLAWRYGPWLLLAVLFALLPKIFTSGTAHTMMRARGRPKACHERSRKLTACYSAHHDGTKTQTALHMERQDKHRGANDKEAKQAQNHAGLL